ncbi:MAG: hypothetical protein HOP15_12955 [Planctomycetes bacterium]|nr:hypothetical protein [Planctomycetota bacterium]
MALLANSPVASDAYGHLWHHLDRRVGVPFSILDAENLGDYDLRRFNVLVLPPSSGLGDVLGPLKQQLASWVEGGGTLIACGSAAAELTKGRLGLSQVVLRQDALEDLASYHKEAERERAARKVVIDEEAVWNGATPEEPALEGENGKPEAPDKDKDTDQKGADQKDTDQKDTDKKEKPNADEETRARLFFPQGATLRGLVDPDAWITSGIDAVLPVLVSGADVYLAKAPVTTAVRLEQAPALRLGGLLWPEARARLAESAWLTVERKGHGQVVLFAAPPAFRGYHLASARLFANAVVLGPGLGADQPDGW